MTPTISPDPTALWVDVPVTGKAISEARARATAQDVIPSESENNWIGYLGEDLVADAFTERGIPVTQNGGVDTLPDLVVGDAGIDVKTRSVTGKMLPHFDVPFTAQHLSHSAPELVAFCAYSHGNKTLTILGGISAERFFTEARFVPRGGTVPGRTKPAALDLFLLPAYRLRGAGFMFDDLRPEGP